MRRWVAVGTAGIACGALLAWVFWLLTRAAVVGAVIGAATASVLVGLAVAGARVNDRYRPDARREADARARRARVEQAMDETRNSALPPEARRYPRRP